MDTEDYTQALVDGEVYTLDGSEDESYLQKVIGYINEKNGAMRKVLGFAKQSADYQVAIAELNIVDDYFKAVEWGEGMECQKSGMKEEAYNLKRELVSTRMKLGTVLKNLEKRRRELDHLNCRAARLESELKGARENFQNLRANLSAETESKARVQVEAVGETEETAEIEAGITRSASRPRSVSSSIVQEASQLETASQTLDTDASAQQPAALADQPEEKRPVPFLRVLTPAPEASRGVAATSIQAATTVALSAAPSTAPVTASLAGGTTDGESARKALQATRKAGFHKGGRG